MLHNAKGGFTDWAVTAGFYAAYHCMLAILAAFGFESRNQTCTLAAIEALQEQGRIALDHRHIGMLRTGARPRMRQRRSAGPVSIFSSLREGLSGLLSLDDEILAHGTLPGIMEGSYKLGAGLSTSPFASTP